MAEGPIELATTSYLYGACMDFVYQDDTLTTSSYCKAFIQGAVNAHKHLTSYHNIPSHFCLPEAVSDKQVVGILLKFIEENHNFIEKPAISTLYFVLEDNFPCIKTRPNQILIR